MSAKNPMDLGRKGWELTVYCFVTYFFGFAACGTMNMLAVQLHAELGWSLTSLYSFQTIGGILCVIAYYVLGVLYNKGRINIRRGILICGVVSAILIAIWSFCGSLGVVIFVVIASVTYLFVQTWGRFFNDNHVANWFPTKKGIVMGWTTIGLPVGSSLGVRIYLWMYAATGGYEACYILFCVIFAILAVWGYISFRAYPEELGHFPDNDRSMTKEKARALLDEGRRYAEASPWTSSRILRTWQVWVLGLGIAFMEFYACIINQMMPNLLSLGYNEGEAANMMLLATLGAGVCSILWGLLDHKIGPRKVILLVFVVAMGGSIARFTGLPVGIGLSMACLGAVLGGGPNLTVSIVSTLWGRYDFKNVFGTILAIGTCFAAFGVIIHSAVAEAAGYGVAYLVQGAGCLIGFVLIGFFTKDDFVKKCEAGFGAQKDGARGSAS
ncbi:MAG: MFS transporter [Clostridiales Family XIII bacterium]|jgi:OFA family oxalate/formate antiporter-like MFS transporter|nr:MFS transporter [Clostridiales Family XIII bacterium]